MEQIALTVHVTTVLLLGALVLYTDKVGLSWIRGVHETIPLQKLTLLHRLVWTGLIIMIISGGTMFLAYRDYLLVTPQFYIKMVFVSALIINAFFVGSLLRVASEKPYAALTKEERIPLMISGAVSTVSWIGAISMGLLLGL